MSNNKLALLFPGQGSQFLGMGKLWHDNFDYIEDLFLEASDTLSVDFKKLCFEDPDKLLNITQYTQPALLLNGYGVYQILNKELGLNFQVATGHSVGEYGACLVGGCFSFAEGVKMLHNRGLFMTKAVSPGESKMGALIGCTPSQAQEICDLVVSKTKETLECVNMNSNNQTVLSGSAEAIDWLSAHIKEVLPDLRKRFIALKTSGAFHSSFMKPARDNMESYLKDIEFKDSQIPIIQNVDAKIYQKAELIKSNLVSQVSSPVLWTQVCEVLKSLEVSQAFEVGPKATLKGLMATNEPELPVLTLETLEDLKTIEQTQP